MSTGISDAALLRALAEDVPDMALPVREHLREIAQLLDGNRLVGTMRCRRCGERVEVNIQAVRTEPAPGSTGGGAV